jgi:hypothetical protein
VEIRITVNAMRGERLRRDDQLMLETTTLLKSQMSGQFEMGGMCASCDRETILLHTARYCIIFSIQLNTRRAWYSFTGTARREHIWAEIEWKSGMITSRVRAM